MIAIALSLLLATSAGTRTGVINSGSDAFTGDMSAASSGSYRGIGGVSPGTASGFTYAANNPQMYVDRDGLRPLTTWERVQATYYAGEIFLSWLSGAGPREFNFGPDSPASKILAASNAFEEAQRIHDLNVRANACGTVDRQVGRNANSWGEFLDNPLWAVTGRFNIAFLELSSGASTAAMYNNTSLTSLGYPTVSLPDYEGEWPGSNVRQWYYVDQ